MIANEVNRIRHAVARGHGEAWRGGCERVLRLTDLTIGGPIRRALRRESLRWRDLIAACYVAVRPDVTEVEAALRAVLQLRPGTPGQVRYLLA